MENAASYWDTPLKTTHRYSKEIYIHKVWLRVLMSQGFFQLKHPLRNVTFFGPINSLEHQNHMTSLAFETSILRIPWCDAGQPNLRLKVQVLFFPLGDGCWMPILSSPRLASPFWSFFPPKPSTSFLAVSWFNQEASSYTSKGTFENRLLLWVCPLTQRQSV